MKRKKASKVKVFIHPNLSDDAQMSVYIRLILKVYKIANVTNFTHLNKDRDTLGLIIILFLMGLFILLLLEQNDTAIL